MQHKDRVLDTLAAIGATVRAKPPVDVVVAGGRASAKKLDACRVANADVLVLAEDELHDADFEAQFIAALRSGASGRFYGREQRARDADLSGVKLPRGRTIDVSGSRLVGAEVRSSRLTARETDFSGARFVGYVYGTYQGGTWVGTCFADATLGQCAFVDVDFTETTVDRASWHPGGLSFTNCRFDGLHPAKTMLGRFENCSFVGFRGVINSDEVSGCNFTDADLSTSFLVGADLASCCLDGAKLDDACVVGCTPLPEPLEQTLPEGTATTMRFGVERAEIEVALGSDRARLTVVRGPDSRRLYWSVGQAAAALRGWSATPLWETIDDDAGDGARAAWAKLLDIDAVSAGMQGAATVDAPSDSDRRDERDWHGHLREAPSEDARWSVFCDWLLQQGDPRGPTLRRLLAGDRTVDDSGGIDLPDLDGIRIRWWRLFFHTITITKTSARRRDIAAVVDHPAAALVQALDFERNARSGNELLLGSGLAPTHVRFRQEWEPTLRKMKRANAHVRELALPLSGEDTTLLTKRFPQLRCLVVLDAKRLADLEVPVLMFGRVADKPPRRVRARCASVSTPLALDPRFSSFDEMKDEQVAHALEIDGLERLHLRFEPTAKQRAAIDAAGVQLVDDVAALGVGPPSR